MNTKHVIRAIKSTEKAIEKVNRMNKIYPELYYDELRKIGNSVVTKWYKSYRPIYYHRTDSLYDAFRVSLDGSNYRVDFDSSFIYGNHNTMSEDYIYNLTFVQGFHGGATDGPDHPNPGAPYWRTPFPQLSQWGRPAIRTFSPYYYMVDKMRAKIKEIDKKKQNEYDAIVAKVFKSINRIIV